MSFVAAVLHKSSKVSLFLFQQRVFTAYTFGCESANEIFHLSSVGTEHLDQVGEMATILEAMSDGRVRAPLSGKWSEDVSCWEKANGEGGLIDKLGEGHTIRGKYVMKIFK